MKKSLSLFGLILVLTFTFCKKKETTPETTPSTTGNSTTTVSSPFYGNMSTNYNVIDNNNVITFDSTVSAGFYISPATSGPPSYTTAGVVSLNSNSLNLAGVYYYNSSPINISGALNWSVAGSGTISAFNYSYTPMYPMYTGGNLLPDTCIKANGINIIINGITNYTVAPPSTGITVSLVGPTFISKSLLGNSGTVSFSAAELAGFSTNAQFSIHVSISNFLKATINGVNRSFTCVRTYQKISYLK